MGSIVDCVNGAVEAGKIDPQRAKEIVQLSNDYKRRLETEKLSDLARIDEDAARSALAAYQEALSRKNRHLALQVIAQANRINDIKSHPKGIYQGIISVLTRDRTGLAKYSNVERVAQATESLLYRKLIPAVDALREKWFGFTQDKALARQLARELLGESTGNADAATFAKAFREAFEEARQMFNRAGGAIAKREDWGLPQTHDAGRIAKVDVKEWKEFIAPRLNLDAMRDANGLPIKAEDLDAMLNEIYDAITTNGISRLQPGAMGGSKLANSRQDARFFVFKDADTWLEYNDRFGAPDLFTNLTSHINSMSHDIALLEVLGPNPQATYRYMRDLARKEKGIGPLRIARLDSIWNVTSGKIDDTASVLLADFTSEVTGFITATKLGSSAITAASDVGYLTTTANWTGLSATKTLSRYIKMLNPADHSDRLFAAQVLGTAEHYITRALAASRFSEISGTGLGTRAADFTMRATGLSAMTDAGRKAFGMELYAELARLSSRSFDDLSPRIKGTLDEFGIKAADWDDLRSTAPLVNGGAKYISMENLMARTDLSEARKLEVAKKMTGMWRELARIAIPEPSAEARAVTTLGAPRGTFTGTLARGFFQFKSFPISAALSHLSYGWNKPGLNRYKYLSQLIVSTTVMGAFATQLNEIAKGRDPLDMTEADFWGASFLKGGGGGIYADFLYAGMFGTNRYGQTLGGAMVGPSAQLADTVLGDLVFRPLGAALSGEDPEYDAKLIRALDQNTPFLSSAWYGKLAFDRLVIENLNDLSDSKSARRRNRANIKKRRNEHEQEYWWSPGETSPDRPPDPSAAIGK